MEDGRIIDHSGYFDLLRSNKAFAKLLKGSAEDEYIYNNIS